MIELQKALDQLGDYTQANSLSLRRFQGSRGGVGTSFIMAAAFENKDVYPNTISGINAEEQR